MSPRRLTLALVALGLATFAQLYAMQGALPEVSREFGSTPSQAALTISLATGGLAASVIPWALVADRIGKVQAMRIAAIGTVVLAIVVVVAPTVELLLVARFAAGAMLGAIPVLSIALAYERLSSAAAASVAAAYIAGTSVGGAAGRLIVGPLAPTIGWRWAVFLVSVVAIAAVVVFLVATKGSEAEASTAERVPVGARLRLALAGPGLWQLYVNALLLMGVQVGVYNYLAFRLEAPPYLFAPAVASLIFAAYAAGTVGSRASSPLVRRFGARAALVGAHCVMVIGVLVMALAPLPIIVVGLVLSTCGFFTAHAIAASQVGARASPAASAQAGALYNVGYYLGSAVGGWALGLPFEAGGWGAFTAAAAVMLLASLLIASVRTSGNGLRG